MAFATGLAGCYVGILLGDLGLWLVGRALGETVLRWPRVRRFAGGRPARGVDLLAGWFDRRGWQAVLLARFVPGTRFPVYVVAGALGGRFRRILAWAGLAAAVWTPILVATVAIAGEWIHPGLRNWFGGGWITVGVAALTLFASYRVVLQLASASGRARGMAWISRVWRWEFWPPWLFYLPVIPWIGYLAIRHRGLTVPTAANPGIPHGGIVGESKYEILRRLPQQWVVPTTRIEAGPVPQRAERLRQWMAGAPVGFPIILKPDVGERGAGVKLIRRFDEVLPYLQTVRGPVLAQQYHPGPCEAGIFYYRHPGNPRGRIFSITDKAFPAIVGDGRSTVEWLIWNHSRYRMQARKFLARLDGRSHTILARGERLPLAVAGNHCQGAEFRDGTHLISRRLEETIDEIARAFDGFFVGRFDVRYRDTQAFLAGRGFAVVELNGATSESTNVYDPSWPIWRAYQTLFRQWTLIFQIGHANRKRGISTTPFTELASVIRDHYRCRAVPALAD